MIFLRRCRDLLPPLALGTLKTPSAFSPELCFPRAGPIRKLLRPRPGLCPRHLYGISLRMFLVSTAATVVARRKWRLRFLFLVERMWLLKPLVRLILPLAVTRKRLAADRLVFSLNTFLLLLVVKSNGSLLWLLRRQQHRHIAPFPARLDVELGDVLQLVHHAAQHLPAQLRVRDLPAAKENRNLDSLSLLDELANVSHFVLDVVGVRARAHFDFLDLDQRVLLRPVRFLFLLVAKLAVIHHAADGRLRVRRHLDQVELQRFHLFERLVQRQHAELFALGSDHPHFARANLMIDSRFPSDRPPPCPAGCPFLCFSHL